MTLWTVVVTSLWTTEKTCYSTVQQEQACLQFIVLISVLLIATNYQEIVRAVVEVSMT